MSGMIWDEARRVRAAIADLGRSAGFDLIWRDVARIEEAFTALEAAIADAWPPPKRDLLPGVLATTAAHDAETFQFPTTDVPLEEHLATIREQYGAEPIEMVEGVHYRTGPDGWRTPIQQPVTLAPRSTRHEP
jgi:hypothetical protein